MASIRAAAVEVGDAGGEAGLWPHPEGWAFRVTPHAPGAGFVIAADVVISVPAPGPHAAHRDAVASYAVARRTLLGQALLAQGYSAE